MILIEGIFRRFLLDVAVVAAGVDGGGDVDYGGGGESAPFSLLGSAAGADCGGGGGGDALQAGGDGGDEWRGMRWCGGSWLMYTACLRYESELGAVMKPGVGPEIGLEYGTAGTQGREVEARERRAGDWTWRHSMSLSASLVYCRRARQ